MKTFYFKAINREGKTIEGVRGAIDQPNLLLSLQNEGLLPIHVSHKAPNLHQWRALISKKGTLSDKQILLFTRELQTLLESGLSLDKALTIIIDLVKSDPVLSTLSTETLKQIKNGAQLSDALRKQGDYFSPFYLSLLHAGEVGGSLDVVLARLTRHLEESKELKDIVSTSMMYPAILLVMSIASLLLLLTFVVPQFSEMFENAGKDLPLPTQIVVGSARIIQDYWWAFPFVPLGGYMSFLSIRSDSIKRLKFDTKILELPLIGELVLKIQIASFCRTLATLMENGVTLLSGLMIVQDTVSNSFIKEKLTLAANTLKSGGNLSTPISDAKIFPIMVVQMIRIGEESGQLADMLHRIATVYDKDIKIAIQRLVALIEPVMIITLGLLIGGIIVSILMAILSINDLAI